MLLSLYEVLVVKSFEHGLLIKQDLAGVELYLQFEKGKDYFDYVFKEDRGYEWYRIHGDNPVLYHPIDGVYYDITFEVSSTYWAKGQKYFTNAVLISIELS